MWSWWTIDWSYRLLTEPEQALFDRLSVFAGGFDFEAAHGVCGEDGAGEDDTLDLLTGLVDKSMVTVRGGAGRTRYGVLETLRSYGRDRLREKKIEDQVADQHARYYTELLERAAAGIRGADEQVWIARMAPNVRSTFTVPDYENLRAAFERAIAVRDIELALRLVTSLPELMHLRVGYHSADWAERAVELADPSHPLFAAAVGVGARCAWVIDFSHARSLAELAGGRTPDPGASYVAYPADVLADVALYEGDAAAALEHYEREAVRTRAGIDPPVRLVFILDRLTICYQALGRPEAGLPAAQEAICVADATANPTTRSLARCALGRALAASQPERALRLLDEAGELAVSVENNWLIVMALMESAAIRAVHADPAATALLLIQVLDLWELGAPTVIPQQWDTLRCATRLLARVGAHDDALALHRAFVGAGRPPPLQEDQLAGLGEQQGPALTGAEAVDLARSSLKCYC